MPSSLGVIWNSIIKCQNIITLNFQMNKVNSPSYSDKLSFYGNQHSSMSTACNNSISKPQPSMPCNTDERQPITLHLCMNMNFYVDSNGIWIKSGELWQEFKAHRLNPKWIQIYDIIVSRSFFVCEKLAVERLVVCFAWEAWHCWPDFVHVISKWIQHTWL